MEASEIVKFQPNIPVVLTLRFDKAKPCKSQFSDEDQFMISAEGGKLAFIPPYANAKLEALGPRRGDDVSICKTVLQQGQRKRVDWIVERVEADSQPKPVAAPVAPVAAAPTPVPASQPCTTNSTPTVHEPRTQAEDALMTSIAAMKAAEAYSIEIGWPIKFDKDDARLFASTILIGMQQGQRR
jgi:hypothetical protein